MERCPKCHCAKIGGPTYRPEQYREIMRKPQAEALIYTCTRCGYQSAEPTKDAEEQKRTK